MSWLFSQALVEEYLGGGLLGWRTVCAVERDAYAAAVLAQRQNDGLLKAFPIWSDVTTFNGKPWQGIVDVVSGGFPCQDISVAGKGEGITGERSGMWSHMARIIGEVRPRFAFVENSPMLTIRGLGVVLSDLAAFGYDCKWTVLGAADVGANHQRDRFWLVADANGERQQKFDPAGIATGARRTGRQFDEIGRADWWAVEPDIRRVAHGVAGRVDRLKAIGNGQVPAVAATAFRVLSGAAVK